MLKSQVVRDYYGKELINLHNRDSLNGADLRARVSSLRDNIRSHFNFHGNISFLPNDYYLKVTLLHNHPLIVADTWEPDIFGGRGGIYTLSGCPEEHLRSPGVLLWLARPGTGSPALISRLRALNPTLRVYISLDNFLYSDVLSKIGSLADFYSFNPVNALDIEGISIFGWKVNIGPSFLGSNSASNLSRSSYTLRDSEDSLEIGTGNFPLLLILEKYFHGLVRT